MTLTAVKQNTEFLPEYEELRQQFKNILITARNNQSGTPNRNLMTLNPITPTLMSTPKNLNLSECYLINTLIDSAYHGDSLTSDGESDEGHSPMSTDTELSDLEDDVKFERQVEGCENEAEDSIYFSTSFITGHVNIHKKAMKRSSGSCKGQGSNPLASSTMIEDVEAVERKRKPVRRGVSIPKASSTLLYKPYKTNKSFSPVVKLKDLENNQFKCSENTEDDKSRSKVNSRSNNMVCKFSTGQTNNVRELPRITENNILKEDKTVDDGLSKKHTSYYCQLQTLPRFSSRPMIQKITKGYEEQTAKDKGSNIKRPVLNSKCSVERKNSVVKKLLRFKQSFKKKTGTTELCNLAAL